MEKKANQEPEDELIQFLLTVGECKNTVRQGWVDHGVSNPESVASHMHRVAVLCMMCPDPGLNRDHMIKMALCHDLGEAVIGDVSPQMNVSKAEKEAKEHEAVRQLSKLVESNPHGEEVPTLFFEYENQKTPEAIFVKDMDLLDMVIQAYRYETMQNVHLDSFFEPSLQKMSHPWAVSMTQKLIGLRNQSERPILEPIPTRLLGK